MEKPPSKELENIEKDRRRDIPEESKDVLEEKDNKTE
jgi:hypothetical protein